MNQKYPGVADLRAKAKSRIPKFTFDYLEGGSNEEFGLAKNTTAIRAVELRSNLLSCVTQTSLETTIMGHTYTAPWHCTHWFARTHVAERARNTC